MSHNSMASQSQPHVNVQSKIDDFFGRFKIATLMHQCGMRKHHGLWDHSTGRFLKGFRMLTICWSNGTSCLPLDFALLSSSDAKKRLRESHNCLDKRCCAYQRRKEAN